MIEEEITSLVITKIAPSYWVYLANVTISGDANAYTGTRDGDWITIKTRTGAPLMTVYYDVVDYIDNLDPLNNLTNPSSAQELQGHLVAQGFYEGSNGGGSGGVTTLKQLLDVNIPVFTGNELKYLRIDEDGQFVIADESPVANLKIQDLINYNGPAELPLNFAFVTSPLSVGEDAEVGFAVAPLYNLVNRPPEFGEIAIEIKGYTIVADTVVPNELELQLEVGDICKFWLQEISTSRVYLYRARYKGGTITNIANWQYIDRENYKFDSEPF